MGAQLKLICPHQSSNLLKRTISKPNRRESGFDSLVDIVNQINDPKNKGAKDPTIVIKTPFENVPKNGIRLSQATSNNYIFESVKAEKAIDDIIKKESNVVEGGGAFQWHYFRFQSLYVHPNDADLDNVAIQVFEQGFKDNVGVFNNIPSVTIKKKDLTDTPGPYLSTDSQMEPERGSNLILIAHKGSGSYPVEYMKYQGAKDTFRLIKLWVSGRDYQEGNLVENDQLTYECIQDHTSSGANEPPNGAFWINTGFTKPGLYSAVTAYAKNDLVVFNDDAYKSIFVGANQNNQPDISPDHWVIVKFVPAVDYSPLTKDKAQYWINAGGGWLHAGTADSNKTAVVDHNVIIKDNLHNRTWVDSAEVNSANIDPKILKAGNPYNSLRILVNGVGVGDFAGNDPRGIAFSGNVAIYRGDFGINGDWFVFRESLQDDEIYAFREGDSWTFKPCEGALSSVDGNGVCQNGARNAGWVLGSYFLIDIPGVGKNGQFQAGKQFDCVHTVKRNDGTGIIEYGNEEITSEEEGSSTSAVFANFAPNEFGNPSSNHPQSYYAGLNFTFLWPRNSNDIPFGPVTIGEKIALEVFDLLNMHQTHTKSREWFGREVEDFYPIQGFAFWEFIQDLLPAGIFNPTGDFSMQIWLADENDNKITIEYTHGHNNVTSPQDAPLGKQKRQRSIPGVATFVPAQQIEVLDIFDPRTVVRGGIETKDVFDADGRYIPAFTILSGLTTRYAATEKIHYALDAFRMTKPIVVTNIDSSNKPDRNIEPEKLKEETVISYAQAKNLVEASETVFAFEREEYPLKRNGRCDIQAGDPFYYEDPELINEVDDALPNTRKLVADKIILSLSKPADGPGGFVTTVHGITRIWP